MIKFIISFTALVTALKGRKISEKLLEEAYFVFGCRRCHVLCSIDKAPSEITMGYDKAYIHVDMLNEEERGLWASLREALETADRQGRIIWDADCSQPGIAQALYRAGLRDTVELHEVWHGDHKLVFEDVEKSITVKELLAASGPGAFSTFWKALAISTYYDPDACLERAGALRICKDRVNWPE